jgi:hypothetical protein
LFNNHIQVKPVGQSIDTLYVRSVPSIENNVGPVILAVLLSKIIVQNCLILYICYFLRLDDDDDDDCAK